MSCAPAPTVGAPGVGAQLIAVALLFLLLGPPGTHEPLPGHEIALGLSQGVTARLFAVDPVWLALAVPTAVLLLTAVGAPLLA